MTAFRLNITALKENVANYKKNINYCNNDISSIYSSLKNVDACWNDSVSANFVREVKNDEYKLKNYFEKINSLYKQIEFLQVNMENLLVRYRYNKASIVNYNDDYYNGCIQKFRNVISNLDSALAYLNACNFKATFSEIYKVYQLKAEIKKIKVNINNLISLLMAFKKNIEKILSDVNANIDKVEDIVFDIDEKEYNWSLLDFDINRVDDN